MISIRAGTMAAAMLVVCASSVAAAPRASAAEPAAGTLPEGQSMLVDDGTCPPGKIKQITGGNTKTGTPRLRSCVRR